MKRLITLAIAIVMLLACTACSTTPAASTEAVTADPAKATEPVAATSEEAVPADDKKVTIGFSVITLTFPAYVSLQNGIIAACDTRGWDYFLAEAGMDVEKTINDCLDLMERDIDALVIASWYGDSLGEVFETAEKKGIPVFMIDTGGLPETGYVTHVGCDDYNAGYQAGQWAAQYLVKKSITDINYISLTSATSVGRNRSDGFLAALNDAEGVTTVTLLHEYLGDSRELFMSTFEDALITYPEINLVFSSSAQGSLGAYDACTAANRTEVYIIGFDNETDEQVLIEKGTQYIASVDQLRTEQAEQTMQCVEDYLFNGKTFEIKTESKIAMNTADGYVKMD